MAEVGLWWRISPRQLQGRQPRLQKATAGRPCRGQPLETVHFGEKVISVKRASSEACRHEPSRVLAAMKSAEPQGRLQRTF